MKRRDSQRKSLPRSKRTSSLRRVRNVYFGREAERDYKSLDPVLRRAVIQTIENLRTADLDDHFRFRRYEDQFYTTTTTTGTTMAFSYMQDRNAVVIADLDQTGIVTEFSPGQVRTILSRF